MSQHNTSTFSLGVEGVHGMVSEIQFMEDCGPVGTKLFYGRDYSFQPRLVRDEKEDDYEALDHWASLHVKPKGFTYHMPVVECKDIKLPVKDVDEHGRPNPDFQ